ncbi:MAG TPA: CmcJ/NvfI family oxidoreductase [Stellaceae bacterium]|nr:CmcJ/NvfI family oxidoreductase [Stellaceae bacterium]
MTDRAKLPHVDGELNYMAPMAERPRYLAYVPEPGEPPTNMTYDPHIMPIHDMRPIQHELDLDREGFALVEHRTAVQDLWDDDEIRRVYYPEAAELIKQYTGASRVFVFDHVQRRRVPGSLGDRRAAGPRQPATRVHVDHTGRSGPQRVRDLLPDDADELLKGRVQVINLWRPIKGPLQDAPLAFCDSGTVDQKDLVESDLVYKHRVGETYSVTYNPAHTWYYAPELRREEALLLKIMDSKTDGRARFMPHTSFTDPTTPPEAFPRESIELRTLVFHPN